MPAAAPDQPEPTFQGPAALAGWLVPGLGHILIGQKLRGIILCVAILSLWLGGLLIGGISVVDHQQHRIWFYGQIMIAPSLAVDYLHLSLRQPNRYAPDEDPPLEPSYGKVHEQGQLFTTLAGMLNLLAILDIVYCDPSHRRRRDAELAKQAAEASPAPTTASAAKEASA